MFYLITLNEKIIFFSYLQVTFTCFIMHIFNPLKMVTSHSMDEVFQSCFIELTKPLKHQFLFCSITYFDLFYFSLKKKFCLINILDVIIYVYLTYLFPAHFYI